MSTVITSSTPDLATATGFGYLGWIGKSNLGDDAIADVLAEQLAPHTLVAAPMAIGELLRVRREPDRRGALASRRLLLGGGTVIGRANWRLNLAVALRACHGGPAVMIGAGVEDPSFRGRRSFSSFGELRRWRRLLVERFESVTVRGPRSAELCASIGVDARVVGDPALLAAMSAKTDPNGPVVVSLGYGDALRGGDQAAVVAAIARALADEPERRVVAASVNPSDRVWAGELAVALGARVDVVDAFDVADFDRVSDGASCVIAERLHAGILAAAAGFAPVMIGYQPKVDDFAGSVGLAVHRTDELDHDALVAAISSAGDHPRVIAAVADLRVLLSAEVAHLRAFVDA